MEPDQSFRYGRWVISKGDFTVGVLGMRKRCMIDTNIDLANGKRHEISNANGMFYVGYRNSCGGK